MRSSSFLRAPSFKSKPTGPIWGIHFRPCHNHCHHCIFFFLNCDETLYQVPKKYQEPPYSQYVDLNHWKWKCGEKAQRAVNNFTLCLISAVYSCCSVTEVVLCQSGVRRSLWMSSATHPCIIDGGWKPSSNQARLDFYSKLCPASMLIDPQWALLCTFATDLSFTL